MPDDILLSVVVITYNHERFIRKALDSILMQHTNFSFEILVGEDCSPDGTRAVLKEYEEKHPAVFRMFYREKNMGATANYYDLKKRCRGKYIACLEGDDFWLDTCKLQKQVDFLEQNNQYIACVHACKLVDNENADVDKPVNFSFYSGTVYTKKEFATGIFPGQTATLVYRNIFLQPAYDYSVMQSAHRYVSDRTLIMLLVMQGDIYCLKEVMSAYRYGSASSFGRIKNLNYNLVEYFQTLESYAETTFGVKKALIPAKKELLGAVFGQVLKGDSAAKQTFAQLYKPYKEKGTLIAYLSGRTISYPFKALARKLHKRT
ncbi:MAG: glycosyltransferase [Oscillospiraceae bacterium]|nr:glycosyltransferase [Oscillospiraceae bacterium]